MTNVVLLTIDSLRADRCSSYGYDRETTPSMDDFASDGVRFENAYSVSSHTRESVPAFLTGRYPNAAVDKGYHLAAPTLATMLKNTHHSGAFHSNPFLSRAYGYDRDFDVFDDDLYFSRHKLVALAQRLWDKIRGHHYVRAETINKRALSWLDSLSDDEDPFFLWNHYMDVHGPYEPPEPYRNEWVTESVSDDRAQRLWRRIHDAPDSVDEQDRKILTDLYDGEVRYTDDRIGEFLSELDERELMDETVVIITSDHGEGLGENGRYGHPRYLFEELNRVPLVVAGEGIPTAEPTTASSTLDLVPTVGHAIDTATETPGTALQTYWTVGDSNTDRVVICEARGEGENKGVFRVGATDGDRFEQYEIYRDGSVSGANDFAAEIDAHLETCKWDSAPVSETEQAEVNARLEALGYR